MVMNQEFYVSDIAVTWQDYPDPEELAVIVYFEGCTHNCKNCQNPNNKIRNEEHKVSYIDLLIAIQSKCKTCKTNKIVFSGGDPFYHKEIKDFQDIALLISQLEFSDYEVCVYTGYSYLDITQFYKQLDDISKDFRWDNSTQDWVEYQHQYARPTWIKCGKYDCENLNNDPGKTGDKFVLASKNQCFFHRESEVKDWQNISYKNMTKEGVLNF